MESFPARLASVRKHDRCSLSEQRSCSKCFYTAWGRSLPVASSAWTDWVDAIGWSDGCNCALVFGFIAPSPTPTPTLGSESSAQWNTIAGMVGQNLQHGRVTIAGMDASITGVHSQAENVDSDAYTVLVFPCSKHFAQTACQALNSVSTEPFSSSRNIRHCGRC